MDWSILTDNWLGWVMFGAGIAGLVVALFLIWWARKLLRGVEAAALLLEHGQRLGLVRSTRPPPAKPVEDYDPVQHVSERGPNPRWPHPAAATCDDFCIAPEALKREVSDVGDPDL
ncbi:MAG: hypothetical protein IMY86_13795 [Chloroflexi bacterium]|nr:hypothetical protein [Chloroflexota bacterium]